MLFITLQSQGGGLMGQLPFMAIMLGVIYFFFIRPSVKKQKEQSSFMTEIKKGQEVVTSSGIVGKISQLTDKDVTLQTSEKTFIKFTKGAISSEMTAAYHKVDEKK